MGKTSRKNPDAVTGVPGFLHSIGFTDLQIYFFLDKYDGACSGNSQYSQPRDESVVISGLRNFFVNFFSAIIVSVTVNRWGFRV